MQYEFRRETSLPQGRREYARGPWSRPLFAFARDRPRATTPNADWGTDSRNTGKRKQGALSQVQHVLICPGCRLDGLYAFEESLGLGSSRLIERDLLMREICGKQSRYARFAPIAQHHARHRLGDYQTLRKEALVFDRCLHPVGRLEFKEPHGESGELIQFESFVSVRVIDLLLHKIPFIYASGLMSLQRRIAESVKRRQTHPTQC